MMTSDVSSCLRRTGNAMRTGRTIGIALIAIALIVVGALLALAWVMMEAIPIITDQYASFV